MAASNTVWNKENDASPFKRGRASPTYSFRTDSMGNISASNSPACLHRHVSRKDSLVIKLKRPNDLSFKRTRQKAVGDITRDRIGTTPNSRAADATASFSRPNAKSSIDNYKEGLCKHEFQVGEDGTLYYNPRHTQQFLLSCSPNTHDRNQPSPKPREEGNPHANPSVMMQTSPELMRAPAYKPEAGRSFLQTQTRGPADEFPDLRATGTALTMSRRQVRGRRRPRVPGTVRPPPTATHCKRFSARWQRVTEIMLENNRALKVQSKVNRSPENEVASGAGKPEAAQGAAEDYASTNHYRSYLQTKYKERLNRTTIKSEYAGVFGDLPPEEEDTNIDQPPLHEPDLAKTEERRHRRVEVSEVRTAVGCKSSIEIVEDIEQRMRQLREEERRRRIKQHPEKSDTSLGELGAKYGSLYKHFANVPLFSAVKATSAGRISGFRQAIERSRKPRSCVRMAAKRQRTMENRAESEARKGKISNNRTYLTEPMEAETATGQPELQSRKFRVGCEEFPEQLERSMTRGSSLCGIEFGRQKAVGAEERQCIRDLMMGKWPVVFFAWY